MVDRDRRRKRHETTAETSENNHVSDRNEIRTILIPTSPNDTNIMNMDPYLTHEQNVPITQEPSGSISCSLMLTDVI